MTGRRIEVLADRAATNLSVWWRRYMDTVWRRLPGSHPSLAAARDYAKAVSVPAHATLRVVEHMWDHHRRDRMLQRIRRYELDRRGIVRDGPLDLRAATDAELDDMWGPQSRVSRRLAARTPDPEPPADEVSCPKWRTLRSLRLEYTGHDLAIMLRIPKMQPWVARPTFGADGTVVSREFAESTTDYAEADKTGCRGVMLCFLLAQGVPYEVYDRAKTHGPRRSFALHDGARWVEITKDCARRCAG